MSSPENFSVQKPPLIGEIFVKRNLITEKQLSEALLLQEKQKEFLGEILVKLGYLQERDIVVALIVQCGLPYIAVNKYDIDPQVIKLIPEELARSLQVITLDRVGNVLSVVMTNPLNQSMKEQLEQITSCRIATFITTKSEITEAISRFYRKGK